MGQFKVLYLGDRKSEKQVSRLILQVEASTITSACWFSSQNTFTLIVSSKQKSENLIFRKFVTYFCESRKFFFKFKIRRLETKLHEDYLKFDLRFVVTFLLHFYWKVYFHWKEIASFRRVLCTGGLEENKQLMHLKAETSPFEMSPNRLLYDFFSQSYDCLNIDHFVMKHFQTRANLPHRAQTDFCPLNRTVIYKNYVNY